MLRMVSALESAGHQCTMFLYDRFGGDMRDHEATLRRGWPSIRAAVVDACGGIDGIDACVATSWPTAHILACRGAAPMRRFYFVQDFEPFFYPLGAEYALAEDSYRFGFTCITIGHMLASLLRERFGTTAHVVEFGCDDDVYGLTVDGPRDGVVFYAKPQTPRRAFQLGVLALAEFHRLRPEVPIHTFGDPNVRTPFPAIHHGVCAPEALSRVYNRSVAGLALSFTNITLLAEEFLACGTVPVINDTFDFRSDVSSDQVRWAPATPTGIAEQLISLVDRPPNPRSVAESAARGGWEPARAAFVRSIEDETYAEADWVAGKPRLGRLRAVS
jgi:WsaF, C-terminal domain/WsaF, N-terminal domain